ncbi:MAG: ATP synthase F1 subunit gamma [Patescibacteria group bacterium]
MAGTKEIKRRIKSVKNTKKITKAMELVAASKMRRAVAQALASRLYAGYSWDLLTSLSDKLEETTHPFFEKKTAQATSPIAGRSLLVLVTSNGSLCGGYNSQIIKKAIGMLKNAPEAIDIVAVGKKGDAAMRRLARPDGSGIGQNIIATFTELPAILGLQDVAPLSRLIIEEFKKGTYAEVHVAYTDFISALSQKPNIRQLLPISKQELKEVIESIGEQKVPTDVGTPTKVGEDVSYTFDGDMNTLIESLAEKLVRMQIYQMLLESGASEQSARMLAMKNASDAAGEMIGDLTLQFNKARQAGITQEISEISAGMASVS